MAKRGSDNGGERRGGVVFCGMLTIVLITLRLIDKISWPWVWVLSPLWIVFTLQVIVGLADRE